MNLTGSNTEQNLARAFAGESQACMRYRFLAERAVGDGLYELGQALRRQAGEEEAHGKVFFDLITDHCNRKIDSLLIQAGYPFKCGSLLDTIRYSADNEQEEADSIYPSFADTAKREGFPQAERAFRLIAEIERTHFAKLSAVGNMLSSGSLYKTQAPTLFVCANCGHSATATDAWKVCPVCGHPQGFVRLRTE